MENRTVFGKIIFNVAVVLRILLLLHGTVLLLLVLHYLWDPLLGEGLDLFFRLLLLVEFSFVVSAIVISFNVVRFGVRVVAIYLFCAALFGLLAWISFLFMEPLSFYSESTLFSVILFCFCFVLLSFLLDFVKKAKFSLRTHEDFIAEKNIDPILGRELDENSLLPTQRAMFLMKKIFIRILLFINFFSVIVFSFQSMVHRIFPEYMFEYILLEFEDLFLIFRVIFLVTTFLLLSCSLWPSLRNKDLSLKR